MALNGRSINKGPINSPSLSGIIYAAQTCVTFRQKVAIYTSSFSLITFRQQVVYNSQVDASTILTFRQVTNYVTPSDAVITFRQRVYT